MIFLQRLQHLFVLFLESRQRRLSPLLRLRHLRFFEPELRQFIAAPLPKQQLVASYQKRVASDPWAKLNQHQLSRGASENDDQARRGRAERRRSRG